MTTKRFIDYRCRQKGWWRNMDNIIINYKHCSEENDMYLIHMNHKCRLDRVGFCPSIWRER